MSVDIGKTVRDFATSANPTIVLLRFLAVGGVLVALYTALSITLAVGFGFEAPIASGVAYLITIPLGYWSQRTFAFRSDAPHGRAFLRYATLQIPLLLLGMALSWLLITTMHGPKVLSFLAIGPSVAIVSFAAQKMWAFSHR